MKKLSIGDIITINLSTDETYEADFAAIVGNKSDTSLTLKVIAAKHGFYKEYSKKCMQELASIPTIVTKEDLIGRVDLRDKIFLLLMGCIPKTWMMPLG